MSTTNKAKRVISQLLGESDDGQKFSEEFTDTLDLMRKVGELENLWWSQSHGEDEDEDEDDGGQAVYQLGDVLFDYGHKHGGRKYGSDILSAAERHMGDGGRISDDFWSDLRGDIAIMAGRAVKSGQLQPYMARQVQSSSPELMDIREEPPGLLQNVLSGDPLGEKYPPRKYPRKSGYGSVWTAIEDASGMEDIYDFVS